MDDIHSRYNRLKRILSALQWHLDKEEQDADYYAYQESTASLYNTIRSELLFKSLTLRGEEEWDAYEQMMKGYDKYRKKKIRELEKAKNSLRRVSRTRTHMQIYRRKHDSSLVYELLEEAMRLIACAEGLINGKDS